MMNTRLQAVVRIALGLLLALLGRDADAEPPKKLVLPIAASEDLDHHGGDHLAKPPQLPAKGLRLEIAPNAPKMVAMSADADVAATDACAKPLVERIHCCTWSYTNAKTAKKETFVPPYREFAGNKGWQKDTAPTAEQDAYAKKKTLEFLAGLKARLPFKEPFDQKDVKKTQHGSQVELAAGWFYGFDGATPELSEKKVWSSGHGGTDYVRRPLNDGEDPTFGVRAVAPGVVTSVHWETLSGNVVVIAHTAPDGTRYRSIYGHLRNGAKADLANALTTPITYLDDGKTPDMESRKTRYALYAKKEKEYADENGGKPRALYWGTESQKIGVKVGDTVKTGQFVGWSGNTGDGGAGNSLPKTKPGEFSEGAKKTGNNHLHFYFGVQHPDSDKPDRYVLFDPYGVYSEASDCYALLKKTAYRRLYQVFPSSFHDWDWRLVSHYFSYYPGMGRALATLNLHRKGEKIRASGSFQSGLPSAWKARFMMSADKFREARDEYAKQGLRPHQLSVVFDADGKKRVTALWMKKGSPSEEFYADVDLPDALFSAKWKDLVEKKKYRVADHFGYAVGPIRMHAAIFVKDDVSPWHLPWGYASKDYEKFLDEKAAEGFRPITTSVEEYPWGRRLGGSWLKVPGGWWIHWPMTSAEYAAKYREYTKKGYRLQRVQGYDDSKRYLAIWRKVDCPDGKQLQFEGRCVPK